MGSIFCWLYSVLWTTALVFTADGAPTIEIHMLEKFSLDFNSHCSLLEYVDMPKYKTFQDEIPEDGDESRPSPESYDLTVPLEACTTDQGTDNFATPLCQEAFQMIRNISTCREDIEVLQDMVPSTSEHIAIAVQSDNVCDGFSTNRNILAQNENYVGFRLADKQICPMVCREKVLKACTFLLWGYQVQSVINDRLKKALEAASSTANGSKVKVTLGSDDSQVSPQGGKNTDTSRIPVEVANSSNDEHRGSEAQTTKSKLKLTDPKSLLRGHQLSASGNEYPESLQHTTLSLKGKSKEPGLQNVMPIKSDRVNNKTEDSSTPKSEEPVLPKEKLKDHKLPKDNSGTKLTSEAKPDNAKPDAGDTVSTAKTTRKSAAEVPNTSLKNTGNISNIPPLHTISSSTGVKDQDDASEIPSSVNGESHRSSAVTQDGTHSKKPSKESDDSGLNDAVHEVEEEKKGKGSSQPDNTAPTQSDANTYVHDNSYVSGSDFHENPQEKPLPNENMQENGKTHIKNDGDPPAATSENHSKNDVSVKDSSVGKLNPENADSDFDVDNLTAKKNSASESGVDLEDMEDLGVKDLPSDDETYSNSELEESSDHNDAGDPLPQSVDDNGNDDKSMNKDKTDSENDSTKSEPKEDILNANTNDDNAVVKKLIGDTSFPGQEDTHFFFYFVTIVIFAIGGYVLFHNKQKIFALIIEGRHERRRRSGASYRKLETK